jgi:hypothetical protein
VISVDGVATCPAKIQAIADWPVPTNVKHLRSFLGLAGYYKKCMHHFGIISRPLTNLLKKWALFVWTADHDVAFNALKSALISALVMALPDFSKTFFVETHLSDFGIGAVLMQDGHPLAFVSKFVGPGSRGLSTYEKEYIVVILVVDQWRSYLQYGEFVILTDHKNLSHLSEQRLHIVWQQKVFTKLLGIDYKIVYKKGSEMG